jgi:2-polyprenyl-3-methyl-5-hydroxy-6-metoxy-1,4-benzoquinol methylase
MAADKLTLNDTDHTIHIKADTPPEANILWRWQGVRLVSHLPCSFDCESTEKIGIQMAELGRKLGYNEQIDWIYEFLSWPVEWSALHGIAEIRTPINKISARTDMTPWKYTVQKFSNMYPEDGMSGITYPYNQKKIKIKPVTKTISFAKSLEDTSVWEENGFSNKGAMDHFHQVILDAMGDMKYIPGGNVLDLGCGNGVLLGRVVGDRTDLLPHGVEIDRQRCMSAATNIHWGIFTMGSIFDLNNWNEPTYSLVLLMPGRLLETTRATAEQVRKQLYEKTDLLLINLTCDWTQQYSSIENIMKVTGLDQEWEPEGKLIHRQDDMAQLFKRKV